jgi:hypothetical protein
MKGGGGADKTRRWEKDPWGDVTQKQLKEWNKDACEKQLRDRISALVGITSMKRNCPHFLRCPEINLLNFGVHVARLILLQHERSCGDPL